MDENMRKMIADRMKNYLEKSYILTFNGSESVYIEYWGMEEDDKYTKRKEIKKSVYKKEKLNLLELTNKHVENLDDYLPKFLLKYGIRVD